MGHSASEIDPLGHCPVSGASQPTAREKASDYFNSLPQEERAKLAPLLEEYRRMGMDEYARKVRGVAREMDMRMRGIVQAQEPWDG